MLNVKKKAHRLIDALPEDQVAYIINIIEGIKGISISDEIPDEFDMYLIKESEEDNDDIMILDKFVEELGFKADELQN
ncbi:MAG: hypothetical protein WBJ13_01205 [Sedimentibacter sp.]